MLSKKSVYLFLLGMIPGFITAQSVDSMQFIAFQVQYQSTDFSDFNDQANALNFPGLENNILEFGFIQQMKQGKWLYNTGGYFGFAPEDDASAGIDFTEYIHAGVSFEISWSPITSEQWFLGPMLSTNLQWSRLILRPQNQINTLSAAFNADYQKFTRFDAPVALGLNAQYYLELKSSAVVMFGLQAGYRLDDGSSWRVDGAVPWENSGLSTQGWFVAFRLGRNI